MLAQFWAEHNRPRFRWQNLRSSSIIYCVLPYSMICLNEPFQLGYPVYILLKSWNIYAATILSICVDLWFGLTIWGSCILLLHVNLSYMVTLKSTIVELTQSELTNPHFLNCFHIYSTYRIVNTLYNRVYLPPAQALFSMNAVASAVLCIRFSSKDDIPFIVCFGSYLVFIVFALVMLLSFTAMVNQYSIKLEKYVKNNNRFLGKYCKCLVRSFKVECISSGGMYPIRKITCVTVLGFLSNLIGSALLSFKV